MKLNQTMENKSVVYPTDSDLCISYKCPVADYHTSAGSVRMKPFE